MGKVNVLRKMRYKETFIYVMQFEYVFQYLFAWNNEIYRDEVRLGPKWWKRWRRIQYSKDHMDDGEQIVLSGAMITIDKLYEEGMHTRQSKRSRERQLKKIEKKTGKKLYLYGTNLSTKFGEVFSVEHTPRTRIADAARISMSIPLFFAAVRNQRDDVYVDGGVLNNYPLRLFDREKYIDGPTNHARKVDYYKEQNRLLRRKQPQSSPYVYNRETLGFRLDTKQEIAIFRDGAEPPHQKIDDFFDYALALIKTMMDAQGNQHLHSDDWHRTVYIDTLGVGTTDFDLSNRKKQALKQSGVDNTEAYFKWYDDKANDPAINRPDSPV